MTPKPGDLVWTTNLNATRMYAGIILNVDDKLFFDVLWETGAHVKQMDSKWFATYQYKYVKEHMGHHKWNDS
jgi:hypothetical protein